MLYFSDCRSAGTVTASLITSMMSFASAKFRSVVLILGITRFAAPNSLPLIWTSAVGTPITTWDTGNADDGLKNISFVPSGFHFTLFGTTYNSVTLDTNGSIYFSGSPGVPQPQATLSQLLQGLPRVTAAWYNVDAIDGNGTIYYNLSLPGEAVFTWQGVASYLPSSGPVPISNLATFQVTLHSDGSIIFGYQALNSLDPSITGVANSFVGSPQAIVGVTDGPGIANDPGSTPLSTLATPAGFTYVTANNTVYQLINDNPPDNSNLAGLNVILTPQSRVGWQVTAQNGAPEPATFVEMTIAALVLPAWLYRRSSAAKRNSGGIL